MISGYATSYADTADMAAYQRALVSFLKSGMKQRDAEANALRVAFVNRNHPGAITYNPLATPPPNVSYDTLWYSVLLAAQGQLQS